MQRSDKGFTLLELSIVLVIISVVMGGAMVLFNQSIDVQQAKETQFKMAAIKKALQDYRQMYNRLPCPADATQAMDATSSNYFGVEAANSSGTCSGGTPAANFTTTASTFTGNVTNGSAIITTINPVTTNNLFIGTQVYGTGIPANSYITSVDSTTQITLNNTATATNAAVTISRYNVAGGMVPTKTLLLPDDYAIDGWGRRIMYMVDVNITVAGGIVNIPVTDSANNRITINDAGAGTRANNAVYLLLSYGKNGQGGYSRIGSSTRLGNISSDADELTNCHCNANGTSAAFSSTFVQKPSTIATFDDLVLYGTRADLRSSNE